MSSKYKPCHFPPSGVEKLDWKPVYPEALSEGMSVERYQDGAGKTYEKIVTKSGSSHWFELVEREAAQ